MPYIGNQPYQGVIDSGNIVNGSIDTVNLKDGSVTGSKLETLASLTAGSYTKITVDVKGRVTAGNTLISSDLPTYTGTLTNTQITTALTFTPENAANRGQINGYASLDTTGKVPSAQLPSYVDDVLEYSNQVTFPASGTSGLIYVALDTNKIYRWSGSAYIEISPSPGTTDSLVEGSTNLYYTNTRARNSLSFIAGSGAYNNTTGVITIPTNTNQLTNGAGFIAANQTITLSGDITGSGNTGITASLAAVGTAGTYTKVTTDSKGRVTSGTTLSSADLPTYTGSLTSTQITNALGFTPSAGGGGPPFVRNSLVMGSI